MRYFYVILFVILHSCSVVEKDQVDENDLIFSNEEAAYLLYDLEKNILIDSHNIDKALLPASLFKIVTAYAALEILGSEHKFETNILYNGQLKDGVLYGDLIIQGLGDPSLNYQDLYNIVQLIKLNGIKEVKGNLLYNDNYFINLKAINDNQPASIYNPGLSSLLIKESNFAVEFNDNRELFTVPKLDYLNFKLSYKYQVPEYNKRGKWFLSKQKHYLPAKDTSRFFMEILAQNMAQEKIKIKKISKSSDLTNTKKIFSYTGGSFLDIIRDNLQYSENIVSEILLLHTAKKLNCTIISLADAANCIKVWYSKKYHNLEWLNLDWSNGSGLSSDTKIAANHLLEILKSLSTQQYKNNFGASLFAVSGVEGTLTRKFREYPLRIWGKTGTMYYISATAGYLYDQGNKYVFVIMANNLNARKEMDDLQLDRNKYEEYQAKIREAGKWKDLALEYQEELISKWLDN